MLEVKFNPMKQSTENKEISKCCGAEITTWKDSKTGERYDGCSHCARSIVPAELNLASQKMEIMLCTECNISYADTGELCDKHSSSQSIEEGNKRHEEHICRFNDFPQSCDCYDKGYQKAVAEYQDKLLSGLLDLEFCYGIPEEG